LGANLKSFFLRVSSNLFIGCPFHSELFN
jgi:hypothetical protein